jgi:protein-disulfide isomerase
MDKEYDSLDYLIKKFRQVKDKKGIFGQALRAMEEQRDLLRRGYDPRSPPSLGDDDAPITILEFMDFQCPPCRKAAEILAEILQEQEGRVRLVFRNFPRLEKHPFAARAAEAALCAHEQGRFWEYHRGLFQNQEELNEEVLIQLAEKNGLDLESFRDCLISGEKMARVVEDMRLARDLGVTRVPTLFINGVKAEGIKSKKEYMRLLEKAEG